MGRQVPGPMRAVGLVSGLGFMLAAMTVLGAWLGHYLDGRWGTTPWLTLAGTLGGMGAGFMEVVAVLKQVGRES
jgi:ATP synthase protein I